MFALAYTLVAFLLGDYLVLRMVLFILIIGVAMTEYMRLKLWKALLISALFMGLLGAIDLILYLATIVIYDRMSLYHPEVTINWSLSAAIAKLCDFFAVVVLRKIILKDDSGDVLNDSEWFRFIPFPLFTLVVIVVMMSDSDISGNAHMENVYLLVSSGLVIITVITFYLMCDIVKRERRIREDDLFREKVKNQAEMYRSVYDNYELQRKRAHEYKNQIMCMEGLLRKKEYGELEKYITEIGGKLTDTDSNISTNNSLIDAIINTKYREMEEQGILLVLKFNEMADLWVEDEDIVVILSNLLNNAIEACEKCDQKTVKLKLMKESDEIIISVRNTYNGEIVKEGEEIRTLKADEEEHGLGIKNIIESVEKYGGSYSINYDDKEFAFSICIPKP
ncbi:MAG: GHKL domain-containing protein [Lachnospiraceae bacterium]|nr:GHKL domain-containing protein [Lachnospiraceae bacterium]